MCSYSFLEIITKSKIVYREILLPSIAHSFPSSFVTIVRQLILHPCQMCLRLKSLIKRHLYKSMRL